VSAIRIGETVVRQPIEARAIELHNGNRARLVRVPQEVDVERVIRALELPASARALLILNGGTAELARDVRQRIEELFTDLARLVVEEQVSVLTGGTEAGVFALFGQALEKYGGPVAPCVGVVAAKQIETTRLEPHHSHFVLVEGQETRVMYRLAAALASHCPSVALFASGGQVTLSEMLENVSQEREMILIAGGKGSTDAVIAASRGVTGSDERVTRIAREARLTVFDIHQSTPELSYLVGSRLLHMPFTGRDAEELKR
jgi:SLOG in TRPM, prokaryote